MSRAACCLLITVVTFGVPCLALDQPVRPPADLRIEWVGPAPPSAVKGSGGETVLLKYTLRNIGGRDAFAVILKANTSLGPLGQPQRLQPGPKAGASFERTQAVALAVGMREICVEASLQNTTAEEPPDPNIKDNRICRAVQVSVKAQAASQSVDRPLPQPNVLRGPLP